MIDFTSDGVFKNQVIVTKPSDLSGDLQSDVVYMVDGVVNMLGQSITVPQGGLTIYGLDMNISGLVTDEDNHTLFIDDGVYAGNLFLRGLYVEVSGNNSSPADLNNDGNGGAIEGTDFNFLNCSSFGVYDGYRQGFLNNFAAIRCEDGLTMEGTWSGGFRITASIIVSAGVAFDGTFLKKGSALSIEGSVLSDLNALQLDDAGAVCDFEPANIVNDTEFLMTGVRVNKNADSFPNMPASSTKAKFTNCVGTENTHIGGQWSIGTEVSTSITTAGVAVKLAGVTPYSDLQHFTGAADNAITYAGTDQVDVAINGVIALSGTNNHVANLIIRQWDDSASSFIDLFDSGGDTLNAGGRASGISLVSTARMDTNDRIEIWVKGSVNSSALTAKLGGTIIISER